MSNYYDYREVKVMIAHKLMNMEGWNVYGYKPDESDSMTDYYSPANWGGIAEKNGYILCVDVYGESKPEEIRKYNHSAFVYDRNIAEKISKLEAMTVERGASEAEASSAKLMIARLQKKAEVAVENKNKYVVVGTIPGHMAHPPRMNWHIEKDGIIIEKGNGILKYKDVYDYYMYPRYMEDIEAYKADKKNYAEKYTQDLLRRGYYDSQDRAEAATESHMKTLDDDIRMIKKFEDFINKIDTACGSLLGEGDGTVYEKITVTEYKKELQVIETTYGEIKEGQLFVLKSSFNYGRRKGLVYRIHETKCNGKKLYHAYKLNGKLTKECTGRASSNNHWSCINDIFLEWIKQGAIAWCELKEVKTPYEVEKVIKKTVKGGKRTEEGKDVSQNRKTIGFSNLTFKISEDTDTRTDDKIFLVKVEEKLEREEYLKVNKYMKSIGGYYSKFKHAFLFKNDPSTLLNVGV